MNRRRTEIGIRMALGADPSGVVFLVLRRVATLVAIGVVAGAALSLWASRFVATLLYGTQPRDPMTFVAAAVVLMAIGLLAGWIPARRAARHRPDGGATAVGGGSIEETELTGSTRRNGVSETTRRRHFMLARRP